MSVIQVLMTISNFEVFLGIICRREASLFNGSKGLFLEGVGGGGGFIFKLVLMEGFQKNHR